MTDPNRPVTGYPAPSPATNGYAQPYAAPPPSYFHVTTTNPSYHHYPNNNNIQQQQQQRTIFLRRIFSIFIGSFIILGTIIFIMWLILRPQIPQFNIQTMTLSNFNLTQSSMISGNWNVGVVIRNPNSKITLYYDHFQAAVYYKSDSIAVTTLAPFVQGKRNETVVNASFASVSEYFDDREGVGKERAKGSVEFNLRMVARVRFKAGAWWTRRRVLRIYCPDLAVGVSANGTNGTLSGGTKQCRVGL